jgi:hypothetical protein
MKKAFLFLSIVCGCLTMFSQKQICVDGNSGGSGDGTPANPYNTIQMAVNQASNGDVIKVAQGTYTEAVQISHKKFELRGGFAGNGDFNTANPQANPTIIEGTGAAPCILITIESYAVPGTLTINGFTIHKGQRGIELAGGYSEHLNNITIENNIIENNGIDDAGQRGGGIALAGRNVTIKNNIFRNNKSGRGAAIGVVDTPVDFLIADNRIENNTGYADHAGAVYLNGTGTVTRNIFNGNVAAKDVGYGWGGAITIYNYDITRLVTLSYNVYFDNSAPLRGGAVFVDDEAYVRMEHELLYNNTTEQSGSAIYVDASANAGSPRSVLYMDNCTVSGNSTNSGGAAIYVQGSAAYIQNCIFWNNGSDFEALDDGQPAILTVDYTLTQQGFAGTGNITSDPLFANAANGDFHLRSKNGRFDPDTGQFVLDAVHSPAIDTGNPDSDYSNEPAPNGGRINMGCYGNTAEASKGGNVGINELIVNSYELIVYPNPTQGELIVNSYELIVKSVEVYDVFGRKQKAECKMQNAENSYGLTVLQSSGLDISYLPTGIYFLRITTETGVVMKKVIKQ